MLEKRPCLACRPLAQMIVANHAGQRASAPTNTVKCRPIGAPETVVGVASKGKVAATWQPASAARLNRLAAGKQFSATLVLMVGGPLGKLAVLRASSTLQKAALCLEHSLGICKRPKLSAGPEDCRRPESWPSGNWASEGVHRAQSLEQRAPSGPWRAASN